MPKLNLSKPEQILLSLKYQELVRQKAPLPRFEEVEFRICSQHGEDGILLYIFSLIGTTNKRAVEICAGDGLQCNTANLILSHGWDALLFDGDKKHVQRGQAFYAQHPDTLHWPPTFVHAWITAENINTLIKSHGFSGEIDLLSLDIDGIDYWLWEALDCIDPRAIVLEFNHLWGGKRSVSIPYDPNFKVKMTKWGSDYAGASLPAFVKLGRKKGYRLVGANRYGTNAFFLRDDVGSSLLPEVDPLSCLQHPRAQFGQTVRFEGIKHQQWVEI